MKGRQMYTIPRQGSGESGSGYSVRSDDLRSVESFYHTVSITLHCLIGIRTSTFDINVNIYLLLHLSVLYCSLTTEDRVTINIWYQLTRTFHDFKTSCYYVQNDEILLEYCQLKSYFISTFRQDQFTLYHITLRLSFHVHVITATYGRRESCLVSGLSSVTVILLVIRKYQTTERIITVNLLCSPLILHNFVPEKRVFFLFTACWTRLGGGGCNQVSGSASLNISVTWTGSSTSSVTFTQCS